MPSLAIIRGAFLLCFLALAGVSVLPGFQLSVQPAGHHAKLTLPASVAPPFPGPLSPRLSLTQAATRPPILQGWGGITTGEVVSSNVAQRLSQSGYNAIRVSFGTAPGFPCLDGELGSWDPNLFIQVLQTTQAYNMTVILDYHGYNNPNDMVFQPCWLNFWTGVILQFESYSGVVWEPINEPAGNQTALSLGYQAFISLARGLGDTHWIAVENTISNGECAFDPPSLVSCYPAVTDPLNQTFLSIHPYLFYDIWQSAGYGNCNPSIMPMWGNSTAECVADIYNQGMLDASTTYHMPILDTEGGAVYYSCNNVCASPPDAMGTNDASYSNTTLHFIQYLTNQMQSENMGWIWWEAGEGSCCGALGTWGSQLKFQPVNPPAPHDLPPTLQTPTGLSAVVGDALSFKVNASDPDTPPQNLTLSCLDCPVGASFPEVSGPGQVTGDFTWTPSVAQAPQSYNITFIITDGFQSSDATIVITVYSKPPTHIPPVLIIPGSQSVTVAETLSFEVNATDIDSTPQSLTLSCTSCATLGATFTAVPGTSRVTGTMNWVPSNSRIPGLYSAEFTVTDGIDTSIATVHVTITKANVEMTASVYPRTLTLGLASSASEVVSIMNGFNPTGTMTFTAFLNNEACTGTPSFTSIVSVEGNGNYASQPFTPQIPGTYRWEASYSGDVDNAGFSSTCGSPARTLTVSTTSPPSQPNGSLTLDSQIVWLTVIGIGGLAIIATATMYRKRAKRS